MVLTEEETAIAKFVVNGLKNVEIAEIMGYSEATVKKKTHCDLQKNECV